MTIIKTTMAALALTFACTLPVAAQLTGGGDGAELSELQRYMQQQKADDNAGVEREPAYTPTPSLGSQQQSVPGLSSMGQDMLDLQRLGSVASDPSTAPDVSAITNYTLPSIDTSSVADSLRATGMSEQQIRDAMGNVTATLGSAGGGLGGLDAAGIGDMLGGLSPHTSDSQSELTDIARMFGGVEEGEGPDMDNPEVRECVTLYSNAIEDAIARVRPGASLAQFVASCQPAAVLTMFKERDNDFATSMSQFEPIQRVGDYWLSVARSMEPVVRVQQDDMMRRVGISRADVLAEPPRVTDTQIFELLDRFMLFSFTQGTEPSGMERIHQQCEQVRRITGRDVSGRNVTGVCRRVLPDDDGSDLPDGGN